LVLKAFKIDFTKFIKLKYALVVFCRKWKFAHNEFVENNAYAKHVTDCSIALLASEVRYLRSNIAGSTAAGKNEGIRISILSETEIGNNTLEIGCTEKNVLRLEVAMHEVMGV
jgi:hypothetical protein